MALTAEQEKAARGLFGDEWVEENILTATKERTKTLEERIAFKENGAMDEEEEVENVSAEDEKADGEPPMDEEDEEEESVSAPAEKAAEDITGRLMAVASKVSDEKTKKAIGNVAGKLTPATQKSQAGTVRMLAARLDGDLKAEMIAISEELAGDGSADSGGDGGGESAVSEEEEKADGPPPSVTGEDEDEEEEAPMAEKSSDDPLDLDYEKLAGVVMEGLKSQLSPLQDGIDSVNEQLSQLGERVQQLETEEAVKMASELPRYVAEQIERASAARETALKNTDEDKELAESAPLETGQKAGTEGSAAQSYFGR